MFFMVLLCTRSQVLEAKHEAEIVRIKAKQKNIQKGIKNENPF
jgi:hypothetical protein